MSKSADENWQRLNDKADRLEGEVADWRDKALKITARRAGFDPELGVVNMTLNKFRDAHDDLDPADLSPESFAEYAEDQGLTPGGDK